MLTFYNKIIKCIFKHSITNVEEPFNFKFKSYRNTVGWRVSYFPEKELRASKSPDLAGDIPIFDITNISRSPDLEWKSPDLLQETLD